MDILQDLLGSMPVGEFLHRYFTRVPFAMPNRAMHYTQAFTAADFAAMVEGPRSVLRVVQNERLIQDHARLSWAEAQVQHHRGHTLLVRYAERSCASCRRWPRRLRSFFTLQSISRSI
jgi:hypothetical protein